MKKIPLTQGKYAIVDDDDFDTLNQFNWVYQNHPSNYGYAVGYTKGGVNKRRRMSMHREIMKPKNGLVVDHINHDTLDNRRENLRVVTVSENLANRNRKRMRGTSQYLGVSWDKKSRKWLASVKRGGVWHYWERFDSEKDAARARDRECLKLWGDVVTLNFPET